jgi:hypothetical protein
VRLETTVRQVHAKMAQLVYRVQLAIHVIANQDTRVRTVRLKIIAQLVPV